MKKSKALFIVGGILLGLIVGFLIGITVNYPKAGEESLSGTIKSVDKYRNVKATEADIQLRNELSADTATLRMLRNYITFHYLDAIKRADDIEYAVAESRSVQAFNLSAESEIENLSKYGLFLNTSRAYYLTALAACQSPSGIHPTQFRNSLNQVNNLIVQKKYRSRSLLDFMSCVEEFTGTQQDAYAGLERAHDLLTMDLVNESVVTGDLVMQRFLGKTVTFTDLKQLAWFDEQRIRQQVAKDAERMGTILDSEKAGILIDQEQLGPILVLFEADRLGVLDMEKLNFLNAEKLGLFDQEKLGILLDAQSVGIVYDAEKLGSN